MNSSSDSGSSFLWIVLNASSLSKCSMILICSYSLWVRGKTPFFMAILQEYIFSLLVGVIRSLAAFVKRIVSAWFDLSLTPLMIVSSCFRSLDESYFLPFLLETSGYLLFERIGFSLWVLAVSWFRFSWRGAHALLSLRRVCEAFFDCSASFTSITYSK